MWSQDYMEHKPGDLRACDDIGPELCRFSSEVIEIGEKFWRRNKMRMNLHGMTPEQKAITFMSNV